MSELKIKIKEKLIEHLNLEGFKAEDIKDDTPLFGDGLGLDSIDALEIIVMLDRNFNIKISNPEEGAKIFQSVNTIAEYIENNKS
ncbi:MAG: acyl carrier protein [Flavobacteriales bacterium]|jgi:acyl carrier protein|nr:acyl carrier protein [Flavobacteriales bacterium]|tara:strand:- start:5458 stop:5712 length:255 start_codon:yes stop_codon:yes gene_type:complete